MQAIEQHIDLVLKRIGRDLKLNNDTKHEILEEMRCHFEDAVEEAEKRGLNQLDALHEAVTRFGIEDVGPELQSVHTTSESIDAIFIALVPVIGALLLRWVIFLPAGASADWAHFLQRPAFWIVAVVTLLIPILQFKKRSHTIITWIIFWSLTLIFALLPAAATW